MRGLPAGGNHARHAAHKRCAPRSRHWGRQRCHSWLLCAPAWLRKGGRRRKFEDMPRNGRLRGERCPNENASAKPWRISSASSNNCIAARNRISSAACYRKPDGAVRARGEDGQTRPADKRSGSEMARWGCQARYIFRAAVHGERAMCAYNAARAMAYTFHAACYAAELVAPAQTFDPQIRLSAVRRQDPHIKLSAVARLQPRFPQTQDTKALGCGEAARATPAASTTDGHRRQAFFLLSMTGNAGTQPPKMSQHAAARNVRAPTPWTGRSTQPHTTHLWAHHASACTKNSAAEGTQPQAHQTHGAGCEPPATLLGAQTQQHRPRPAAQAGGRQ